jgi:hypothetical protein
LIHQNTSRDRASALSKDFGSTGFGSTGFGSTGFQPVKEGRDRSPSLSESECIVKEFHFSGTRKWIKLLASKHALNMVRLNLLLFER